MAGDSFSLVKPFSAIVNSNGVAVVDASHSLHGIAWVCQQIGFSLGVAAQSPEVSALFNGLAFVSTLVMSNSPFSGVTGRPTVAMTAQFSGPPYVTMEAGDVISLGVQGATAGDTFQVALYVDEGESPATANARRAQGQYAAGYIPRSGTARW